MKPNRALTPSESLCKSHEMVYVQLIDFLNYEILFSIYMSNLGKFISQNSRCTSGAIEQPLRAGRPRDSRKKGYSSEVPYHCVTYLCKHIPIRSACNLLLG